MGKLRLAILELTAADRAELESLANRRKTAQALALRARIVLGCASGMHNKDVAAQLDIVPATVSKWRRRFLADGLDGLRDEPRSGTPRTVDDARIEAVITRTLESLPSDATHWSSRGMARASGLDLDGAADLAGLWASAPPRRHVQTVDRSRFCRQGPRCGRAICRATSTRDRAVRR